MSGLKFYTGLSIPNGRNFTLSYTSLLLHFTYLLSLFQYFFSPARTHFQCTVVKHKVSHFFPGNTKTSPNFSTKPLLLVQLEYNIVCTEPTWAQRRHNSPGTMTSVVPLPQVSFPQAPDVAQCESSLQNGPLHPASPRDCCRAGSWSCHSREQEALNTHTDFHGSLDSLCPNPISVFKSLHLIVVTKPA